MEIGKGMQAAGVVWTSALAAWAPHTSSPGEDGALGAKFFHHEFMTLQDRYSGFFLPWTGYCPVRTFPSLSHTHTLFITVQGTTNHTLYSVYADRVRTYMVPIAMVK